MGGNKSKQNTKICKITSFLKKKRISTAYKPVFPSSRPSSRGFRKIRGYWIHKKQKKTKIIRFPEKRSYFVSNPYSWLKSLLVCSL